MHACHRCTPCSLSEWRTADRDEASKVWVLRKRTRQLNLVSLIRPLREAVAAVTETAPQPTNCPTMEGSRANKGLPNDTKKRQKKNPWQNTPEQSFCVGKGIDERSSTRLATRGFMLSTSWEPRRSGVKGLGVVRRERVLSTSSIHPYELIRRSLPRFGLAPVSACRQSIRIGAFQMIAGRKWPM